MTEKRRGLGRGLGALIPSTAEASETTETAQGPRAGRPVDLFFAAASDEVAPGRAGGSRRGAGINKDALRSPAPKKTAPRSAATRSASARAKTAGDSARTAESAEAPEAVKTVNGRADEAPKSTSKPAKRPAAGSKQSALIETQSEAAVASGEATVTAEAPDPRLPDVAAEVLTAGETVPADDVSRETLMEVPGARFAELPIDSIHPNRKQPRSVFDEEDMSELVHSIREIGVLQPIVVRPSPEDDPEHPYELVMGERRWRASREAGLDFVPAIIRSTQDVDLLRDALLENLHRSQLNPLEEAAAYQQLLDDFECSHEELAERIGRSRPQISNTLRLMKLPPLVQRRLAAGVLSAGHARALLG